MPMMMAKLVNSSTDRVWTNITHYEVTRILPDSKVVRDGTHTPGILIELCPGSKVPSIRVKLPDDGTALFVMNSETGKTIQSYRYELEQG